MTSLIKIANTARNDLDIAQRQLDAEKKKTARNQAAAKIEMLETKLAEVSIITNHVLIYCACNSCRRTLQNWRVK